MSGEAQLEALLEIINRSASQAIAEYKKGGNDVPTIHSQTYHPVDFATDAVALKKAYTGINFSVPFEWACMHVVVRAKVAHALEKYPNDLHIDELSTLVNLEKGKLARVLRFLTTKGCFAEVAPNTFANNRISLVTLSSSENGAFSRFMAEDVFQGAAVLYETMTEPGHATSYHPERAPLIYALKKKGFNGGFFDFLKQDAERRENFHRAMIGGNRIMGSLSVLHYYPWDEVKTVCDVVAGVGAVSLPLSKMYPDLKLTDQDLLEVLVHAKDVWAKDAPEVLQNNQVEFVLPNFLQESPVQGQDVYHLRNIIHDWPDAEAVIILKKVREAMAPHNGTVLTPSSRASNTTSFGLTVAPEPLLSNLGNRGYHQDMVMWFIHNAKERTLDESIALGSAADLRLDKVYDLAESAVLEFRIAA